MGYYYNKKELFDLCIKTCKGGGCFTVEDVFCQVGCTRDTFYRYFPAGSKENEKIKDEIRIAKRRAIVSIRGKLYKSKSPQALLALYRMICDEEERKALTMTHSDVTTQGKEIKNEALVVEVIDKREQVEKPEL